MRCDFYGKVFIEPTTAEHNAGAIKAMTNLIADKFKIAGINDYNVAVEMTGVYHRPVKRAFRQTGFDIRTVHPFASKHFRSPLHLNSKTDDHDLEAIFHASIKGYGLATLPVDDSCPNSTWSVDRVNALLNKPVKKRGALPAVQTPDKTVWSYRASDFYQGGETEPIEC